MLSRKNRLSKSFEIEDIKKTGKNIHTPLFLLIHKKNNYSTTPRFAFVVSRKISKKAVVRNRIKRIYREAVKMNLSRFPAEDYLFIIKSTATEVDLSKAHDSINKIIDKL